MLKYLTFIAITLFQLTRRKVTFLKQLKAQNVLIAVAACGVIVAGFMTYFNINKVETIKAEIVETNAALEAIA